MTTPKMSFVKKISKGFSMELVNQMANAKSSSKYLYLIILLSRVPYFSRNSFVGVFFLNYLEESHFKLCLEAK